MNRAVNEDFDKERNDIYVQFNVKDVVMGEWLTGKSDIR